MGKVRDIASNLKRYDLQQELDIIVENLAATITGFNKAQLEIGQDVEGSELQPYSDPFYAIFKKDQMGSKAPLGIPNLKLTGDFYEGFTLIINDKGYTITSTDVKVLALEGKYGDIFGLQDDNLAQLCFAYILPELVKRFKEQIFTT